jgi:hypothetical protein
MFFLCGEHGEFMEIGFICQDIFFILYNVKKANCYIIVDVTKSSRILKLVIGPEVLKRAKFRQILPLRLLTF